MRSCLTSLGQVPVAYPHLVTGASGPERDDYKNGGRRSILEAHPHLEAAADRLHHGMTALMEGELGSADDHFSATLFSWPDFADAGRVNVRERLARPGAPRNNNSQKVRTKRVSIPDWALNAMFLRDGWRCRYCGLRIIPGACRAAIVASCGDRFAWGSRDLERHPALAALWGTPDHVEAHASGGGDNIENLVTACWTCQFQKGSYSLELLDLEGPADPPAQRDGWDGLEQISREVAVWAARQGRGWKGELAEVAEPGHDENPDATTVAT